MIARSLLFVPGDKPRMLEKAGTRGAHGLIIDLEDAVAPTRKEESRRVVAAWLADWASLHGECWVRINAGSTGMADLEALGPLLREGVMVPKAESPGDLERVAAHTAAYAPDAGIIALIETAGALLGVAEIARLAGVRRLMLGTIDLGAELGLASDAPAWDAVGLAIVAASAAAHIEPPLAGIDVDFGDPDRLESETRMLAASGFGGRPAIHPAQIEAINRAFTPTIEEARAAMAALARHASALTDGQGAYTDEEGRMVDEAVLRRARHVVEEARRAGIELQD
jgi:citrate lyase subunit beta/citryl-CoA lyase